MTKETYEELFLSLQQIVRSLENDTIGIDELEREIGRAYSIIDVLQIRLTETSVKVDELIRVKEKVKSVKTEQDGDSE